MQVYIIQNGMQVYIKSTWIHYIHMDTQYPHVSKGLERPRRMLIKMLTVIISGWLEFRVNLQ